MIPSDWEESIFLNLYKGKDEALDHGTYHGLKLTDQVMKLLKRVLDRLIHNMVNIDEMHSRHLVTFHPTMMNKVK